MKIPFGDLKRQYRAMKPSIDAAVSRVLESGWFVLGREVEAFEAEFAGMLGIKHAVGVGSGTEALHLALRCADPGEGAEVVTVANTAVPTICAILAAGCRPVFVDVEATGRNMDPSGIEGAINDRTRAIMPVHLHGCPAAMGAVMEIAGRHHLAVIEDASQAHGAAYQGRPVGTIGDFGCFSFYPSKNLGCYGDGGAVVTNSDKAALRLKMLRNYGQEKRYYHAITGFNSRLDEIQAAILRAKLPLLTKDNEKRRAKAARLTALLGASHVTCPAELEGRFHVFHLYAVESANRDRLQAHLAEKGIQTLIHYPIPVHLQAAYRHLSPGKGSLPVSEKLAATLLSLPLFPELEEAELDYIAEQVLSFKG